MRKQLPVFFVCMALVFGATGCSDDDDVPRAPTTEAAYQTTQTIVTGVNLVTEVRQTLDGLVGNNAFSPASGTNGELVCNGDPLQIGPQFCLDGMATLCLDPGFVTADDCEIEGFGVASGSVAWDRTFTTLDFDLTINDTLIVGTVTDVPSGKTGVYCQNADYDIDVTDLGSGAMAWIEGEIQGCDDGTITGQPTVDLPGLMVTFRYSFEGDSATIDVYKMGEREPVGVCTHAELVDFPDCQSL